MATTQLSVIGVPGKPQSYSAKDEAAASGPHTGDFTELSILGVPGRRHSFVAKDAATGGGEHTGEFTTLSVLGVPGGRHIFIAKSAADVVTPTKRKGVGGHWIRRQEEEELIMIAILESLEL